MKALIVIAAASAHLVGGQPNTIETMLADRLVANPDAGIVVATIDGSATNVIVRGKAPLDENSPFEIGGLTELFVAIALADMAAKREVDLADPVAKYLPGIAMPTRGGKSIALEDLATHRSALPRTLPGIGRGDVHRYAAYAPARLADFLEGYELPRDIGSRYERSQLGIALLATALTKRAAVSLDVLLNDRVIAPLGLTSTRIRDGTLQSTANDLLKLAAATIEPAGPLASALSDTLSSRGVTGARGESVGLGWRIRHAGTRQIMWSSGASASHQAFIASEPALARAVVVLHNQPVTVDDIGFGALEHLREAAMSVDVGSLQTFVGEYEIKRGLHVVVRLNGRKLTVQVGDELASTLTQDSELRFVFDDSDARVTFVRDANGVAIGLMLHRGGQHIAARRVR